MPQDKDSGLEHILSVTVAGQEAESYTRTLHFGVWHPKSVSLDMSLISRKISAEVKAVTCEIQKGNTLTLPCSGTVCRGCFLHALPWGGRHLDAQVTGCWHSFHIMEITSSVAKSGACYLSSSTPETLGAWCGSLQVKKLSTAVFASDNTGLISGGFSWPLQVQGILYEMFRYRICKMKNSQTGKRLSPQAAMEQHKELKLMCHNSCFLLLRF